MSDPDGRIYHVLTALLVAGASLAFELYGGLSWLARWLPDSWNLHAIALVCLLLAGAVLLRDRSAITSAPLRLALLHFVALFYP